jgi:ATP diphosphatase
MEKDNTLTNPSVSLDSFIELYGLLKRDRKVSPWSRQNTLSSRFDELRKEIEELREAIKSKDYDNIMEEIGDVLLDVIFLSIILEENTNYSIENSIKSAVGKIKRRKPWIFSEKNYTIEEEIKMWNEAKSIENSKKLMK